MNLKRAERFFMAAVLASSATLAVAQSADSADELLWNARRVLQQVDQGHMSELWQQGSPLLKQTLPKDQFVNATTRIRAALGAVRQRSWTSVSRVVASHEPGMPDGVYGNVHYTTTAVSGQLVDEQVSFRQARDGQWLFTAYLPRVARSTGSAEPARR